MNGSSCESMSKDDKHRELVKYCYAIERIIKSCKDRDELWSIHTDFNSICNRGTSCLKEKSDELIDAADESNELRKENESLKEQLDAMKKEMQKMKRMKEMMKSFIDN